MTFGGRLSSLIVLAMLVSACGGGSGDAAAPGAGVVVVAPPASAPASSPAAAPPASAPASSPAAPATTAAVTEIRAEPASRGSIALSWSMPSDAATVVIERAAGTAATAALVTLPAGSLAYTDTALSSGTRYTYRVRRALAGHLDSASAEVAQSTYSGPIVITAGGTYSGNWESTDPAVAAVTVRTAQPVVIEKSRVRSMGKGIDSLGFNADLTVRDTVGTAVNPGVAGKLKGCFVDVGNFTSVVIEQDWIEGWACGLRALNYGDSEIASRSGQRVQVRFNQFRNIDGRRSDGAGGYQVVLEETGQVVGLNSVLRSNTLIEWNDIVNEPYKSRIEDGISAYTSGGTSAAPIVIANNYLQGAYHGDPAAQVNYTGAGINLGDCPSANPDCGYVSAHHNTIVSFSNAGMGVAGGHHMRLYSNRVVSAARAPDGTLIGSNWRVGYGFWNYYNSAAWADNALFDNYSFVVDRNNHLVSNYTPSATPSSVYGNVSEGVAGQSPTRPLDSATELAERQAWLARAAAAGVVSGPRRCEVVAGIRRCT